MRRQRRRSFGCGVWRTLPSLLAFGFALFRDAGDVIRVGVSVATAFQTTTGEGLNVAVIGGGPAGILLSHLLLSQTGYSGSNMNNINRNHRITILDSRKDPRAGGKATLDGRAYALGIGIRGRTAIRTVDEGLWERVKSRGYESEKFNLHLTLPPFAKKDLVFPLRRPSNGRKRKISGEEEENEINEPSLLVYQSELCSALLAELEERYGDEGRLRRTSLEIYFNTKVIDCNFGAMTIETASADDRRATTIRGPFDLIVGCDGVNSVVRSCIDREFPAFQTTKTLLPGSFKVVRLDSAPPDPILDPEAVSALIPSGAFIEPTGTDGSCCILFSGSPRRGGGRISQDDDAGATETLTTVNNNLPLYLTETKNATAVIEALSKNFPRWIRGGGDGGASYLDDIAKQLIAQDIDSNSAYSVVCNTYHFRDKAVLLGDAAHATGGVSGQGLNSALIDSVALAECISSASSGGNSCNLEEALMNYSLRQVPEGKALYDLSFGPNPPRLGKKLRWMFKNALDALFGGRRKFFFKIGELPLQTRLSSEMTPFATIRRERNKFYYNDDNEPSPFPSDSDFEEQLVSLHKTRE